ncbi:hypothetical protein MYCTH_2126285 [Thermothelomyces thermophilus ATCC 42464]|uniref:Uncharacterized protein n=1 Tax=Thermothelomyces thermophilus (strain ATCC 42464 / BCRC 31852 / DSM 1799) TaxID=573729 RepID=G2QCB1_THET4|nr:uncharacterized protein MYCTH_2126285 [Thermothelomyces thermophilus ATCC 42464]AEO57286.1 hypothetical protein MYCTH_2126285 [Thermothelomyces thermophilus ATCC 42464]
MFAALLSMTVMVHQIVIKLHLRCIISARSIPAWSIRPSRAASEAFDRAFWIINRHLGGEVRFESRAAIYIILNVSKEAAPEMGIDGSLTVEAPRSSCRRIGAIVCRQANMGQGKRIQADAELRVCQEGLAGKQGNLRDDTILHNREVAITGSAATADQE